MIIAQKKAFLDGVNALGSSWLVFNFTGTEPTKDSEFTFDNTDVLNFIKHCKAASSATASIVDGNYAKFVLDKALLNAKGMEPIGKGVVCNNVETNMLMTLEARLALMNGMGQISTLPACVADDYIILDLGYSIEVDTFNLKFASAINSPPSYEVEYWDGSTWVSFGSVNTTSDALQSFSCGQSTTRLRIKFLGSSARTLSLDLFRIVGTGVSLEPVDESITWSIIVPRYFSSFDSVLQGNIPFFYCSTTRPNAGGDLIVSEANPTKGQEVRLIAFSVKADLLEF